MSNLKVGDLCVTQNTTAGLLNNGLLVVIVAIDPTRLGAATPYLIRRIDGKRIPSTLDLTSGVTRFYSCDSAWSSPHKLRRVDPDKNFECSRKTEELAECA